MSSFNDHPCPSNILPGNQPTATNWNYPSGQHITERSVGVNTQSSSVLLQRAINNQMTSAESSSIEWCQRSEDEEEDNLTDAIERLIHEFLVRPSRRQPYKSFFRWTTDCGFMPPYHVELKIAQNPK